MGPRLGRLLASCRWAEWLLRLLCPRKPKKSALQCSSCEAPRTSPSCPPLAPRASVCRLRGPTRQATTAHRPGASALPGDRLSSRQVSTWRCRRKQQTCVAFVIGLTNNAFPNMLDRIATGILHHPILSSSFVDSSIKFKNPFQIHPQGACGVGGTLAFPICFFHQISQIQSGSPPRRHQGTRVFSDALGPLLFASTSLFPRLDTPRR